MRKEQLVSSTLVEARARRLQQAAQRGATLIEVIIVVAIMAMIAGGVSLVALPKYREAQRSTAKTSAMALRRAIQSWQMTNNEITCPTHAQLVDERQVDSAADPDDPWGQPWAFECSDDEVFVRSSGPDKQPGTDDDIEVPPRRGAES